MIPLKFIFLDQSVSAIHCFSLVKVSVLKCYNKQEVLSSLPTKNQTDVSLDFFQVSITGFRFNSVTCKKKLGHDAHF